MGTVSQRKLFFITVVTIGFTFIVQFNSLQPMQWKNDQGYPAWIFSHSTDNM